jgi:RNA exonuclease NGL2
MEEEGADPDRVIVKARPCTPEDGLLTTPEILNSYSSLPRLQSMCSAANRALNVDASMIVGSRSEIQEARSAYYELIWTSYTHYWKSTLGTSQS